MKTWSLRVQPLVASLVLFCFVGRAALLEPILSKTNAIAQARSQGKLMLLVSSNTNTCTSCFQFEYNVLPSPNVRQFIEEGLVYWACGDEQGCTDYRVYIPDYPNGFPLPLVCLIDPFHPDTYVARSFGGGEAATMLAWFRLGVLQNTAPRVMNLATNQTVNTTDLVIQGTSRWTNVPIWRVYYQLNGGAWVFSTVTNFVDWLAPLNRLANGVQRGTNVFQVYAKDISYNKSHTNAVTFIYDPNAQVGQPPTITQQPVDLTVAEGATAQFSVVASGTPPVSYHWWLGANLLIDGPRISGSGADHLMIQDCQPGDAGNYTVVVSDPQGSTTSAVARLTVPVPPGLALQPANDSRMVGQSTTFTVLATGTPPLSYQWWRGTTMLADDARISGAGTNSLTISALQTSDSGGYTVVVTNAAGSITSAVAQLTVTALYPISITAQPQSQVGALGSSFTFNIAANGQQQTVNYMWYFQPAGATAPTLLANSTHSALPVQAVPQAVGSYFCIVSNQFDVQRSQTVGLWLSSDPKLYIGITVYGMVGQVWQLQYTTNLTEPITWIPIPTSAVTLTRTPQVIIDPETSVTNVPARFYRAELVQ